MVSCWFRCNHGLFTATLTQIPDLQGFASPHEHATTMHYSSVEHGYLSRAAYGELSWLSFAPACRTCLLQCRLCGETPPTSTQEI